MSLRFEGKKPVGINWDICNDGKSDPSVWRNANKPALEPGMKRELKRAAIKTPGIGRGGAQRLPAEVEVEVIAQYRDQKLSALTVAANLGIRSATVFKVLRRNNVPTRSRSEGMRLSRAASQK